LYLISSEFYLNKDHLKKKVNTTQTTQKLKLAEEKFFNINALIDPFGNEEKKHELK